MKMMYMFICIPRTYSREYLTYEVMIVCIISDLSQNQLESVSGGALAALTALTRLSLAECALRRVPAHALRDLPSLHHLLVSTNVTVFFVNCFMS